MTERYPGYDVLAKRRTPSWNEQTRQVIDHRLAITREPRYLSPELFNILDAVCARIVPQPGDRPPVPLAALVDTKLYTNMQDGFRYAEMPEQGEAWRRGLAALDEAALAHYEKRFPQIGGEQQDDIFAAHGTRGALGRSPWRYAPTNVLRTPCPARYCLRLSRASDGLE
jgi:hypothetical protein